MLRWMASNKAKNPPAGVGAVALLALGVAVLLGGVALHAHRAGIYVRWTGIALLTVDAIRRRKLTPWILLAMVAGVEFGADAPGIAVGCSFLSAIFLRLIKAIVAPLILGTLVVGIAGQGELKSVGRLGLRALIYFELATTVALIIGLVAINLSRAGERLHRPGTAVTISATSGPAAPVASAAPAVPATQPLKWDEVLVHMFPENIAKSVAENQLLQVAVFAVFFGAALSMLSAEKRAPLLALAESLSETMLKFTGLVMYLAPLGVFGAMAATIGKLGLGVLWSLGVLVLTLYGAMIAFFLCFMVPVALGFRIPLRRFLEHAAEPATIAFATATSEAALPAAMEQMELFGVPRRIVAFVIPAGYSFNLDGSCLYLAVASVFVAQAAGMHMSWGEQVFMMATLVLTSKGVAGVARAALVVLLATAASFHLPEWPITLLFGFDALLDMGRTMINVLGNCLACAVMAKWEGDEKPAEIPDEAVV